MKKITRALDYEGGYYAAPMAPPLIGKAAYSWTNLRLLQGKSVLTQYPGMRRCFMQKFSADASGPYALDQTKRIMLFDAQTAFGVPGVGLKVVDYRDTDQRVLGLGYIAGANPDLIYDRDTATEWDTSAKPNLMMNYVDDGSVGQGQPKLYRGDKFEFPALVHAPGKIFVHDTQSLPSVFDGSTVREAGLRPPRRKPVVKPAISTVDPTNFGTTAGASAVVVTTGYTVAASSELPRHAGTGSGLAHIKISTLTTPDDTVDQNIFYINSTETFIAGDDSGFSLFVRWGSDSRVTLPANTFSVLLATSAALGGTIYEFPIDKPLKGGRWHDLFFKWDATAGSSGAGPLTGTIVIESWGVRRKIPIPNSAVDENDAAVLRVAVPNRWFKVVPGPFSGRVRVAVSWFNPKTGRESSISPASDEVDLGQITPTGKSVVGIGLRVYPLGYRGYWDVITTNALASDPMAANMGFDVGYTNSMIEAPEFTHLHVYLWRPAYGRSATRDFLWRRMTDAGGILIATSASNCANLTNSLVAALGASTIGADYVQISDAYSIADAPLGDIRKTLSEIDGAPQPPAYVAPLPSCELAMLDGSRQLVARQKDFRVGTTTVVKGMDLIKLVPGATNAFWSPAFVGRQISILPDGVADKEKFKYLILDWVKQGSTYWLRIGRNYDPITGEWEHCEVASGTHDYVIHGWKDRFWFSAIVNTANPQGRGIDFEGMRGRDVTEEFGSKPVIMPNDEILSWGHAGPWLIILGRNGAYRTIQQSEEDSSGFSPYAQVEPISGAPGAVGTRAPIELPGNRLAYITNEARIAVVTPDSFEYHPLSDNLRDFFLGKTTSADQIVYQLTKCFGLWSPNQQFAQWHFLSSTDAESASSELEGSEVDTDTSGPTYDAFGTLDLLNNVAYAGGQMPITCALRLGDSAPGAAEFSSKLFAGGEDGYLYEINREQWYSMGSPQAGVLYTVSTSTNNTVTLTQITNGSSEALNTTGDGLKGLNIVKFSPTLKTVETRVVLSNTADKITVTANWTVNPVAGVDHILISPMKWRILFSERRVEQPGTLDSVSLDLHNFLGPEMWVKFRVFVPSGARAWVLAQTPTQTRWFRILDLHRQKGRIRVRPRSFKAVSYDFSGYFVDVYDTQFAGFRALEWYQDDEEGRALA